MIARERPIEWSYVARDLDGAAVGRMHVRLSDNAEAPAVVRDQHGSTWLLKNSPSGAFYQRVACEDATLRVRT
jgi:hypothetical protein